MSPPPTPNSASSRAAQQPDTDGHTTRLRSKRPQHFDPLFFLYTQTTVQVQSTAECLSYVHTGYGVTLLLFVGLSLVPAVRHSEALRARIFRSVSSSDEWTVIFVLTYSEKSMVMPLKKDVYMKSCSSSVRSGRMPGSSLLAPMTRCSTPWTRLTAGQKK